MSYELYKQDCLEFIKNQPDQSIDIIFTSPPYNVDIKYNTYTDQRSDYEAWLKDIFRECQRILTPGGRLIINIQPSQATRRPTQSILTAALLDEGYLYYGERIWDKGVNSLDGYIPFAGSVGRSSKPHLWYHSEYILIFSKGSLDRPCSLEQSLISRRESIDWSKNTVWQLPPGRHKRHPAVFSELLAERVIKLFARQGDRVYDPFSGTGTTVAVAHRLGCHGIGTEIDQDYFAISEARLGRTNVDSNYIRPNEKITYDELKLRLTDYFGQPYYNQYMENNQAKSNFMFGSGQKALFLHIERNEVICRDRTHTILSTRDLDYLLNSTNFEIPSQFEKLFD